METKKALFKGREIEVRTFTYGDYFEMKARGEQINADTALWQVIKLDDREFLASQELDPALAQEFAGIAKAFSDVNPKLGKKEDEKDGFLEPRGLSSGEIKSSLQTASTVP